jgi:hypothetical protein
MVSSISRVLLMRTSRYSNIGHGSRSEILPIYNFHGIMKKEKVLTYIRYET